MAPKCGMKGTSDDHTRPSGHGSGTKPSRVTSCDHNKQTEDSNCWHVLIIPRVEITMFSHVCLTQPVPLAERWKTGQSVAAVSDSSHPGIVSGSCATVTFALCTKCYLKGIEQCRAIFVASFVPRPWTMLNDLPQRNPHVLIDRCVDVWCFMVRNGSPSGWKTGSDAQHGSTSKSNPDE